jgi:hypothetical protein
MTERDAIPIMHPDEFRECIKAIGWRVSDIAWMLGIDTRVSARWASGVREVPRYVGAWLRILAEFHTAHQLPEKWRTEDMRAEEIAS